MKRKTIANIIEVYENSEHDGFITTQAVKFVKSYINDPNTTNEDIIDFLKIINGVIKI